MDSAAVLPFVDIFLGNKPALADVPPLDIFVRRLLVLSRGAGIDKNGNVDAKDLRPIGNGDALRRITAQCAILKSKGHMSAIELADDL